LFQLGPVFSLDEDIFEDDAAIFEEEADGFAATRLVKVDQLVGWCHFRKEFSKRCRFARVEAFIAATL
jgi:hypothetical protein